MSNVIVTPNMGLALPVVGVELGPQYASDNNGCLTTIDGHDHANGGGVRINPAGININSDLPLNGNNLTLTNSVQYINQVSPLPGASPFLNTTYFAGGDFYANDGAGNQVQITSGGTVNATSSGISSGTATASFIGGVLVVNSNVNTPANIQAGSILIGNNISGSNFATLQAPSALGANYSLTLPPSNSTGSTAFMIIDTSNNMGEGPSINAGITQGNLANNSVGTAQIIDANVTRAKIEALGMITSPGLGSSTSFTTTPVSMGSVTITPTGINPVFVSLFADFTAANTSFIETSNDFGVITIQKDGSNVAIIEFGSTAAATTTRTPVTGFCYYDFTATAVSHKYEFFVNSVSSGGSFVNVGTLAYEMV